MYMDYIFNDLGENHWGSLFGALSTFSKNVVMEEAVKNGASEEPRARVPLPPSDPPSPPVTTEYLANLLHTQQLNHPSTSLLPCHSL